ncbi:MAG TPA: hypothetical protein VKP12_06040 [Kiloniellaceae bacterium]|nr:hypothetical protein [Kiloniellaceae bacterium]
MLFKRPILDKIARGEVTLAFRCWRRPTVKAGGRLRTAVGVLAIEAVEPTAVEALSAAEARRAGFRDLADLQAELARGGEGTLYRIAFRLAGADPRVALREAGRLDPDAVASLLGRLDRLDAGSRTRPWTRRALRLIGAREGTPAAELAGALDLDKPLFKRRVRQLKELGLTESLPVGYRLSPRGLALLAALPGD